MKRMARPSVASQRGDSVWIQVTKALTFSVPWATELPRASTKLVAVTSALFVVRGAGREFVVRLATRLVSCSMVMLCFVLCPRVGLGFEG